MKATCLAVLACLVAGPAVHADSPPPPSAPDKVLKQADRILRSLQNKGQDSDSPAVARWTAIRAALAAGAVSDSLLQQARSSLQVNREAYDEQDHDHDGDGTISALEAKEATRQLRRLQRIFRSLEILHGPPAWMQYRSYWGPWDELPYRTRKRLHNIPALATLVVTDEGKRDFERYMQEAAGGIRYDGRNNVYGGPTVTWTGRVHGVINQPEGITLSDPRITFRHRLADSRTRAGITYRVDDGTGHVRHATLDSWQHLDFSTAEFSSASGDLTGKFYHDGIVGLPNIYDAHYYIVGRVNGRNIVGIYRAER